MTATQLGAHAIKSALERVNLAPSEVQGKSIWEMCFPPELDRLLLLRHQYGLGFHQMYLYTINKVCASGMKAIALAAESILLGDNDCVIAGGWKA